MAKLKEPKGMTLTVTKDDGDLTAEELRKVGEMIEDGFKEGIGNPYGLDWEIEES